MSAWGIGSRAAAPRPGGIASRDVLGDDEASGAQPLQPAPTIDTIVAWIPGDVMAAYAALVLAFQPEATNGGETTLEVTSVGWLIGAIAFAALLTVLGAWSKSRDLSRAKTIEVTARAVLAAIAFAIWSLVIPGSWWYSLESFAENSNVVPIVAGIVGVAFSLVAEGIVQRLPE